MARCQASTSNSSPPQVPDSSSGGSDFPRPLCLPAARQLRFVNEAPAWSSFVMLPTNKSTSQQTNKQLARMGVANAPLHPLHQTHTRTHSRTRVRIRAGSGAIASGAAARLSLDLTPTELFVPFPPARTRAGNAATRAARQVLQFQQD